MLPVELASSGSGTDAALVPVERKMNLVWRVLPEAGTIVAALVPAEVATATRTELLWRKDPAMSAAGVDPANSLIGWAAVVVR